MYQLIQDKSFDSFVVEMSPKNLTVSKTSYFLAKEVQRLIKLEDIFNEKQKMNLMLIATLEAKIEATIASLLIDNGLMPVRTGLLVNKLEPGYINVDDESTGVPSKRTMNLFQDDPIKGIADLFAKVVMYCFEYNIEVKNDDSAQDQIFKQLILKLESKNECGL